VASSSHRPEFELKITRHRPWFDCFQCVVLGDDPDVHRGKPSPDIFLTAAARMRALPERCLVLEDAPSGLEAARAAGMSVVAVPNPGMSYDAFGDAVQILPSLESFDPTTWGLPGFHFET
jgi:beta-phosphoglucomutase-like phosphatase (HAD superfamily)